MPDTTLNGQDSWIEMGDPFSGKPWTESEIVAMQKGLKHQERVRLHCVEVYSSSPLYQARAAKDPEYWKDFSTGLQNL